MSFFQKSRLKQITSIEINKSEILKGMAETREFRRQSLSKGATPQIISKVLNDYPKLMDFNGLLV